MKDKEPLSNEEIQNRIRKMMARRVERDYELSKKFMLFGSQGPQTLTRMTGPWGPTGPGSDDFNDRAFNFQIRKNGQQ